MKLALLVLSLVLLVPVVSAQPVELWVPFPYWFYSADGVLHRANAVTYRHSIIYFGTYQDGWPYVDPETRQHEHIHWQRIQAVGYDKWMELYLSNPAFACREERIASGGAAPQHWKCREWKNQ